MEETLPKYGVTEIYLKHDYCTRQRNEDGTKRYKYIIHKGSSRSSKTVSLIEKAIRLCEENDNFRITVWRDTKTSVGSTVWESIKKVFFLSQRRYQFSKTTRPIYFENGSVIEPFGADEIGAHGLESDVAWLNEPYKINKDTFDQIDQRAGQIWIDWNPKQGHWIDKLSKLPNAIVIHSTFKQNPFCPVDQKAKILSYEPYEPNSYTIEGETLYYNGLPIDHTNKPPLHPINSVNGTSNLNNWLIYGLGIKSEKDNKIYRGWQEITIEEYNSIEDGGEPIEEIFGLDFGSSAPSALAGLKYKDGVLYVREVWYKPIPRSLNYVNMLEGHNVPKDCKIIADSAEPDEIRNINGGGFWCTPCAKGKGSVKAGINFLQTLKVKYVGLNIEKEFGVYEWEMDRYGEPTDKPIKSGNHILDAIRYGAWWLKSYHNL